MQQRTVGGEIQEALDASADKQESSLADEQESSLADEQEFSSASESETSWLSLCWSVLMSEYFLFIGGHIILFFAVLSGTAGIIDQTVNLFWIAEVPQVSVAFAALTTFTVWLLATHPRVQTAARKALLAAKEGWKNPDE